MPGAGKSTIGKQLSEILNYPFVDLDLEIEKGENLSIRDIFENFGESHFRAVEKRYLSMQLSKDSNFILACGGGTPCFHDGMNSMLGAGHVFYLRASVDDLVSRLENNSNEESDRPLLNVKSVRETVEDLMHKRQQIFEMAHYTVDSDRTAVDTILKILEEKPDSKSY